MFVRSCHNTLLARSCAHQVVCSTLSSQPVHWCVRRLHANRPCLERIIVKVPTLADSISEGTVSNLLKKVGDSVESDEPVFTLETDKVDIEVNSTASGAITKFFAEIGQTVEVGDNLFEVDTEGSGSSSPNKEEPGEKKDEPKNEIPAVKPDSQKEKPDKAKASAPKEKEAKKPASKDSDKGPSSKPAEEYGETRVPMSKMRLAIAKRLKEAQNTCAMLTTFNEVDMSNLMALRKAYQEEFAAKHGVKLGFMSAFMAASTAALKDQPVVNAVIDGNEIVYRDSIDISVAVSTSKGLVVPVIRQCNHMNYADFEKAIVAVGDKARANKLALEDMAGGTFTISNGGVFRSLMGTPIINLPQSAILGMHGTVDRPVAIKGKVEIRPMMYLALTYDHRLIDGREAVTFLRKIKQAIEEPATLLLAL